MDPKLFKLSPLLLYMEGKKWAVIIEVLKNDSTNKVSTVAGALGDTMYMGANNPDDIADPETGGFGGAISGFAKGMSAGPLGAIGGALLGGLSGYITTGYNREAQEEQEKDNLENMVMGNVVQPDVSFAEEGGLMEIMSGGDLEPVQMSKGEMIMFGELSLVEAKAKKTHDEMEEDDVTDISRGDSYVFTNSDKYTLKKSELKEDPSDVLGYMPVEYSDHDKTSLKEADKIRFSDIMPKEEMTYAEVAKAIKKKFKTSDREDDIFAEKTNAKNKESRLPYLQRLIHMQEIATGRLQDPTQVKKESMEEYEEAEVVEENVEEPTQNKRSEDREREEITDMGPSERGLSTNNVVQFSEGGLVADIFSRRLQQNPTNNGDNLTPFEKKFAEERADQGPGGIFEFKGKEYTTDYADESSESTVERDKIESATTVSTSGGGEVSSSDEDVVTEIAKETNNSPQVIVDLFKRLRDQGYTLGRDGSVQDESGRPVNKEDVGKELNITSVDLGDLDSIFRKAGAKLERDLQFNEDNKNDQIRRMKEAFRKAKGRNLSGLATSVAATGAQSPYEDPGLVGSADLNSIFEEIPESSIDRQVTLARRNQFATQGMMENRGTTNSRSASLLGAAASRASKVSAEIRGQYLLDKIQNRRNREASRQKRIDEDNVKLATQANKMRDNQNQKLASTGSTVNSYLTRASQVDSDELDYESRILSEYNKNRQTNFQNELGLAGLEARSSLLEDEMAFNRQKYEDFRNSPTEPTDSPQSTDPVDPSVGVGIGGGYDGPRDNSAATPKKSKSKRTTRDLLDYFFDPRDLPQ